VGRSEPELQPVTRRPQGPMRQLSPEERRRWQNTTLATPRRRYGADARLLFKLEDLVFGPARTLPKFRPRELIARTPTNPGSRRPISRPANGATAGPGLRNCSAR
jgi:hypothetical protein